MYCFPQKTMQTKQFSTKLIQWQKENGRHNLPWQVKDPYARWVSEIMLQQTQVSTVIEYFERFMSRFPTVQSLACATEDEVMQYWSGLGYYSRARNLHKTAQIIVNENFGVFPKERTEWEALPGIGRSTAAAIVAFSFGAKETILDGNVKRVLMRLHGIDARADDKEAVKKLWAMAEDCLPDENIDVYIQGLMDFGATLCTKHPKCLTCIFQKECKALEAGLQEQIPRPKKRLDRPVKERTFLLLWLDNECLLQKRAEKGVWKGLFSLPQKEGILTEQQIEVAVRAMGMTIKNMRPLESFSHDFSHYRLILHPVAIRVQDKGESIANQRWASLSELPDIGLPAPIRGLLERFFA